MSQRGGLLQRWLLTVAMVLCGSAQASEQTALEKVVEEAAEAPKAGETVPPEVPVPPEVEEASETDPEGQSVPGEPENGVCLESHEQAQIFRMEGDLLGALVKLKLCVDSSCPEALRKDCGEWLTETEEETPELLLQVLSDSGDVDEALVTLDGSRVEGALSGRPMRVNPGARAVRIELATGEVLEKRIVLLQGESRRTLQFDFRKPPPEKLPAPPPEYQRPIPPVTYLLSGLALGAAGLAVGFGVDAKQVEKKAQDECAPFCSEDVSLRVNRNAALSDVFLGVSLAATAGAVVTYFYRPKVRKGTVLEETALKETALNESTLQDPKAGVLGLRLQGSVALSKKGAGAAIRGVF